MSKLKHNTQPNILVVDDHPENLHVLTMILKDQGYSVHPAKNGRTALSLVRSNPPDLILLDIIMAKKEGPDVAADIRRETHLKEVPIIFLTATVTQEEVDEGGGVIKGRPFVAKPSDLDILMRAIEQNL